MQADEAICSRSRRLVGAGHVMGIDDLQLRLLGVAAEREAGFEPLQRLDGDRVVTGAQAALGIPVEDLLGGVHVLLLEVFLLVLAEEGNGRAAG